MTIKTSVKVYRTIDVIPSWAKPSIQKFIDKGILTGTGVPINGKTVYDITDDQLRMFVVLDKMNLLK